MCPSDQAGLGMLQLQLTLGLSGLKQGRFLCCPWDTSFSCELWTQLRGEASTCNTADLRAEGVERRKPAQGLRASVWNCHVASLSTSVRVMGPVLCSAGQKSGTQQQWERGAGCLWEVTQSVISMSNKPKPQTEERGWRRTTRNICWASPVLPSLLPLFLFESCPPSSSQRRGPVRLSHWPASCGK